MPLFSSIYRNAAYCLTENQNNLDIQTKHACGDSYFLFDIKSYCLPIADCLSGTA